MEANSIVPYVILLGIIIILSWRLNLVNKKNKVLSAKNDELEMIRFFLDELSRDTNSMVLNTEIINKLPLNSISPFWRNIFMYNYQRIREYSGRFLGQYILGYFKDIEDEEKRNYFYSVLDSALLRQPVVRLINIFLDDLREDIIDKPVASLVEPKKVFREWFLKLMVKNFESLGRGVLDGIKNGLLKLKIEEVVHKDQKRRSEFWLNKINTLLITAP